jgi:hypothetical protein
MFWSQINFRVQQRRRAVLLVNQEKKPQASSPVSQ